MSRTKEITEDLRKRADVAHQAVNVTIPSLKSLDSTNPQLDKDHCYPPEKRSTNKDHSNRRVIVYEY